MKQPEPVLVVDLFPEERRELLALLAQLPDEDWDRPTVCAGWSVKDVGLHLLGDDLGVLSRKRDRHAVPAPRTDTWSEMVASLNGWNQRWVEAARRISPRLLLDLLAFTGEQTYRYFTSLDLFALGEPVSWAGPDPAPVWLDVAREYTERWLHHQHLREAVDKPGLKDRHFFAPVLATFVRALPHTFREVQAPAGSQVRLIVTGDAGSEWLLVRHEERWSLHAAADGAPDAVVRIDQEAVWRLFTKGLDRDAAAASVSVEGDRPLGMKVLDTVAIIA